MPEEEEYEAPDVSKFLDEQRRQGLQVLHPIPSELEERIKTISRIGGRKATWITLFRAWAMWQIKMELLKTGKTPTPEFLQGLSPVNFYLLYSPSLGGEGRDEVVKIARSVEGTKKKPSMVQRVMGDGN